MKKLIQQLAGESMIYGLSGIITKLINIFLVPLYTRVLLPSDYGALNLINTTFYFASVFIVFALDNSVTRWFYDSEQTVERKKPFATWFWFQLAVSVVVTLLFVALSLPLSKLLLSKVAPQLLIIPAVTLISSVLPTIVWNWLRLQRKAWTTMAVSLVSVFLTIALNILFVLVLKLGVKGILLSLLISNIVYSLVAAVLMKGWLNYRYFSVPLLKAMLAYSLPLLPTSVAFWVLNSSSSYFIKIYHSAHEVGLFSIGASVASAVSMVVGAFQMAWGPFALSIMNRLEAKSVYSSILTLYTIVASLTALTVAIFSKEALMLFTTPDYYSAYLVSGILAFNAIIYGYAYIAAIGISVSKKTSPLAIAVGIGALITTVLYLILIPLLGKEGAALSTLFGYIIIPIYVFYKSQKEWYVPYRFMPSIIILCSAVAIFIMSLVFSDVSLSNAILIKIMLLTLFLIVVGITLLSSYKKEIHRYVKNRALKVQLIK